MIYYAGIGSRETPQKIQELFISIAQYLANKGYVLRSGGADGADLAFEHGCAISGGKREIYLPWRCFNGSYSSKILSNPMAFEIAAKYHPYWNNLKDGAKKLQARNTHQVLGEDLETPSSFIICWTKGGKLVGGTAQAIRIANDYNIPVFNAGSYSDISEFKIELKRFLDGLEIVI